MILPATGNNAALRIISQPASGSVGLSNNVATYYPSPGFVGQDVFTFAAYDGSKNSQRATGMVSVVQGLIGLGVQGYAPSSYASLWSVPFQAVPAVTNTGAEVTYDWDFGDGSPHGTSQTSLHSYQSPGLYVWTVAARVSSASAVDAGIISIDAPVSLNISRAGEGVALSWPDTSADTLLETTGAPGASAQWLPITNEPFLNAGSLTIQLRCVDNQYFRVRRPW
jgi:PKD repeat protein